MIRQILLFRLNIYLRITTIELILTSFLLCGCSDPKPADPMCRLSEAIQADPPEDAACIIRAANRLLVLTLDGDGKYTLPGGHTEQQQSAQCTAHYRTWMQTGFNVEVKQYLGSNAQGMRYYQCNLSDDFGADINQFPVPDWAPLQISRIDLIDPFAIEEKQWQKENQLTTIRDMFNQIK
jgi:hypothetical protein